jgi:hypothetical protein
MRMAARVDDNQNDIVRMLRKTNMTVLVLSAVGKGCPDICVGYCGRNFLFELKDGEKTKSRRKLTEKEKEFFDGWKGHVGLAISYEDVIEQIRDQITGRMKR